MDIRGGYKKTDVGIIIPNDWYVFSVKELLEGRKIVGHIDGNHGELYPRSNEFTAYGIPYVGATDFVNGIVDFGKCKYLSIDRAVKFKKGIAISGDVLFAHNATVGPVTLLETNYKFIVISTTATYYRCNINEISNVYLKAFFESIYFSRQYEPVMSQSTRNQVPITAQRKFFIVIPPLPEQQAIATVLSDIDRLISSLTKLIDKKKNIKQGAMQELLTGKKRLVGFSGNECTKETAVGVIPQEWECCAIEDILESNNSSIKIGPFGSQLKKEVLCANGPYKVYGQENVFANDFLVGNRYLNKDKFLELQSCELFSGDIIISMMGTIGKCVIVPSQFQVGIMDSHLIRVRINSKCVNAEYIKYLIAESQIIKQQIKKLSVGGIMSGLSSGIIKQLYFPIPSLAEQKAISTVLIDLDADINMLERKLYKYKDIKQGMMQELLSGRIRLVEGAKQ